MQRTYQARKFVLQLLSTSLIALIGVLIITVSPKTTLAASFFGDHRSAASCPAVGNVTNRSLLIVLLDRSGSLIINPGATDPDGYSTSVTKTLADLWPGSIAVILSAMIGHQCLDQRHRQILANVRS